MIGCNYKNRIIEPLHSRCSVIEFNVTKKEIPELCSQFYKRLENILKTNGVEYDSQVVLELIKKYNPDWRRILNELQRYSATGKIDVGILVNISETNIKNLMLGMKKKEFTTVRKWVVDNLDNDSVRILRTVYDNLYEYVDGSTIPHCVVVLGEYQYKSAFVADQEINLVACLTELMSQVKFK